MSGLHAGKKGTQRERESVGVCLGCKHPQKHVCSIGRVECAEKINEYDDGVQGRQWRALWGSGTGEGAEKGRRNRCRDLRCEWERDTTELNVTLPLEGGEGEKR